jgi:hypothetical protein
VLRVVRDFIVMNAAPDQVGLPGAGWRIGLVTTGSALAMTLHSRYGERASTIDSSRYPR